MREWREMRLGDAVQIAHGWPFVGDLCSEELSGKPIVVSIGNFRYTGGFRFGETMVREYRGDYPIEYELSPGDILLVMTCQTAGGEILGIPARIPDDGRTYLHNQRMGKVVVTQPDMIDEAYLYWLFQWSEFNRELFVSATGTKILHTAPTRIEAFRFNCPPLPEQRAIASILGSLDDKIELNRRMNETLESLAQTLFKSWFIDPTRNGLPKGWTERALYDCADYINGAAFRNEHFSADRRGLPVIKIGELKDGINSQTKFCEIEREAKYRISSGEVLFSWSGSPDTSIDTFIWTEGDGWLNQHIFKIQFKQSLEKFFVYYLLRHLKPVFIEIARDKQTTGLGHVTAQDLKRLKVFFPTDDLLTEFNHLVQPLFQKYCSNLHESRTLAAMRDALLPKLISGELRALKQNKQNE